MKISSAIFDVGGATPREVWEQSSQRAKAIAEVWACVKDQWQVDVTPEKHANWAGYTRYTITADELSEANQLPVILSWCMNSLQEKSIPYQLELSIDVREEIATVDKDFCSAMWLPGQKAPIFFATYFLFSTATLLQNVGLLSKNDTIALVNAQQAQKYDSNFRNYCIDLRVTAANNRKLDRFLGG